MLVLLLIGPWSDYAVHNHTDEHARAKIFLLLAAYTDERDHCCGSSTFPTLAQSHAFYMHYHSAVYRAQKRRPRKTEITPDPALRHTVRVVCTSTYFYIYRTVVYEASTIVEYCAAVFHVQITKQICSVYDRHTQQ